ncbi:hypothetical protein [Streptosporangium sp. G12]
MKTAVYIGCVIGCAVSLMVMAVSIHDLIVRPFDPSDVAYLVLSSLLIGFYMGAARRVKRGGS